MICQTCKSKVFKVCKVVKKVEIFECLDCQLGFIPQGKKKTILSRSLQDSREIYDFQGYEQEEKKLRRRFERLAKIIKEYKKSGKVLDVGAGYGLFSSILSRYGKFQLHILEPQLKTNYLRSTPHRHYKTTIEGFLGLTKFSDHAVLSKSDEKERYDLIIMMDVMEHFRDPLSNLKKVKSLLKRDGILIVQTPNYKSLMTRICRDWAWWMIEDHKFFFSPKSLKLMLAKAGFRSEYFITYEDWGDFKKNLDGNFVGIKVDAFRKFIKGLFFTFFIPFHFLTRKLVWRANLGGLMFTVARKAD